MPESFDGGFSFGGSIPIPKDVFNPQIKVKITASDNSVHTVADTSSSSADVNQLISMSFTKTNTDKLGNFTLKLNNNKAKFLDVFEEGDSVDIYIDYTGATTHIFRGKVDNVYYSLDDKRGFMCNIEGRQKPELVDDKTVIQFDTTNIVTCFKGLGGDQDSYGNYEDGILYDTGLYWSDNNTLTVGSIGTTVTRKFQNKSFWGIISELCGMLNLDCYIKYDTTETRWDIRVFKEGSIKNEDEHITQGMNLINVSRYGKDNTQRSNIVIGYGKENDNVILLRTEKDDEDINTSWNKKTVLNNSSLESMEELEDYVNKELTNRVDMEKSGKLSVSGVLDVEPGEKINCSVPYCGMDGYHRIKSCTYGLVSRGKLTTSITIEEWDKGIADLINDAFDIEEAIKGYKNLNDMDYSFNLDFSKDVVDDWLILSGVYIKKDVLRLTDGSTTGTMTTKATSDVPYTGFVNNITECELRIKGNQYSETEFEVSNNNGVSWENINIGEVHEFSTNGKNLRIRVTLNETNEGVSPEFGSMCILFKTKG